MRGGVRLKRNVHRLGLAAARRTPGAVRVPRLLSIVVTVRDAEAELDECLTSLREQDHWACEIVVVDLGLPAAGAAVAAGTHGRLPGAGGQHRRGTGERRATAGPRSPSVSSSRSSTPTTR